MLFLSLVRRKTVIHWMTVGRPIGEGGGALRGGIFWLYNTYSPAACARCIFGAVVVDEIQYFQPLHLRGTTPSHSPHYTLSLPSHTLSLPSPHLLPPLSTPSPFPHYTLSLPSHTISLPSLSGLPNGPSWGQIWIFGRNTFEEGFKSNWSPGQRPKWINFFL